MASAAKVLPEIEEVELADSDMTLALAEASKVQDAQAERIAILAHFAADFGARLYMIEMAMGTRDIGTLRGVPQRTVGPATKATYANVYEQLLTMLGADSGVAAKPA